MENQIINQILYPEITLKPLSEFKPQLPTKTVEADLGEIKATLHVNFGGSRQEMPRLLNGSENSVFEMFLKVVDYHYGLKGQTFKADLLTRYTKFLVDNGYCDTDVYTEGATAIDRFMHTELNK